MKHRMYCRKSEYKCLVNHMGNECPDERDCEACKAEADLSKEGGEKK